MMHHMSTWANKNELTLIAKDVPQELASALKNRDFIAKGNDFIRNYN